MVLEPLDEESVAQAAEACRALGVQAVAVCLLALIFGLERFAARLVEGSDF